MRSCDDCKVILEDSVRYCPKCGKSVQDDNHIGMPNPQIGVLITSANLHRVRKEWDKAIDDATEALKIDPNNAATVSLLANIYEQQGMIDEARIWYQAALELNPANAADKAHFDRINSQIIADMKPTASSPKLFTKTQIGILAAVFVFILTLTLLLTVGNKPKPSTILQNKTGQSQPNSIEGLPRNSIKSPVNRASEPSLDGRKSVNTNIRTSAEVAIRDQINKSQAVQSYGAKIDDVIADPREEVAIVTFTIPSGSSVAKANILAVASAVARQTFAAHSQVKFVTTRCIVSGSDSESSQIAFIGDMAKTSLSKLNDNPTLEQLQNLFANPWWNPQIGQTQP